MQDSRLTTLIQLLAIKKRHEQRIRRALSKLARREKEIFEEEQHIQASKCALQTLWRQRSESKGILSRSAFQKLKIELAGYYEEDRQIAEHLELLKSEKSELNKNKENEKQHLRQNLIDQEKLEYAIEQERT